MVRPSFGFDAIEKEADEVGFLGCRGDGDGVFGEDAAELGDLRCGGCRCRRESIGGEVEERGQARGLSEGKKQVISV